MSSFSAFDDDSLARRLRSLAGSGDLGPIGPVRSGPRVVDGQISLDSAGGGLDPLRSAGTLEQRQIVAQADGITVVIDIDPIGSDEWQVSGEVIGLDLPAAVQFLDDAGSECALTVTDEIGEFSVIVARAASHLVIASGTLEIVLRLPSS